MIFLTISLLSGLSPVSDDLQDRFAVRVQNRAGPSRTHAAFDLDAGAALKDDPDALRAEVSGSAAPLSLRFRGRPQEDISDSFKFLIRRSTTLLVSREKPQVMSAE